MSIIEAIILGIIQGATEFLPISSSGHLVLLPTIFNMTSPDLTMTGLVHLGSLMAVLIYFRQDLWQIITAVLAGLRDKQPMTDPNSRLGWYIAFGSIPAAVAGLLLEDFFEDLFAQPVYAASFLLVTAVLLIAGERLLSGEKTTADMTWLDALIIGLFQMLALFPGISRSGSTIVGGLIRGLDRSTGARYSFLLGVPVILGAGLLSVLDIFTADTALFSPGIYIAAFIAAGISGYICIAFLISWVRHHSLYIFAAYTAVFGTVYLLLTLL
ncbi:MAG: undecaprenyl-diphosphatase UppP [Chloroflexi bacterium]|nr:undecaprenyl-diphosphatase UppP [Chloroflexota bacterium]